MPITFRCQTCEEVVGTSLDQVTAHEMERHAGAHAEVTSTFSPQAGHGVPDPRVCVTCGATEPTGGVRLVGAGWLCRQVRDCRRRVVERG